AGMADPPGAGDVSKGLSLRCRDGGDCRVRRRGCGRAADVRRLRPALRAARRRRRVEAAGDPRAGGVLPARAEMTLEHFPPKHALGHLIRGWAPAGRRKCDKRIESRAHCWLGRIAKVIQFEWNALLRISRPPYRALPPRAPASRA